MNTCDEKSHHVGGKQVIKFLDGYATPLQCRSGLMYMSTLGKPTDQDLDQYPHVIHSSPDTIPTRNGQELSEIWVSKVGTNF